MKIFLSDKIFEILVEGPIFGSPVSLAVMIGAIIFRFEISRIMWLRFQTLQPGASKTSWIGSFSGVKLLSTR